MSDCLYNWQQLSDRLDSLSSAIAAQHITILEALQQKANEINGHVDFRIQELTNRIPGFCNDSNDSQNVYWQGKYNDLKDFITYGNQQEYMALSEGFGNTNENIDNTRSIIQSDIYDFRQYVESLNLDLTEVIQNLLDIKEKIGEDPENKTVQEKLIDSLVKIGEIKVSLNNVSIGVNGNSVKLIEINGKSDDIKGKLDDTVDVAGAITSGYVQGSQLSGNYADDEIDSLVAEYETLEEPLPVPVNPGLPVPVPPEKALVVIAYSLGLLMAMQTKDLGISLIDMIQNRSHNVRHKKFKNESYLPWLFFEALKMNRNEYTENVLQILPWGTDSIMMRKLRGNGFSDMFKIEGGEVNWSYAMPFKVLTGQTEYLTEIQAKTLVMWPMWQV